jgi:anti-sigma factor RsiW
MKSACDALKVSMYLDGELPAHSRKDLLIHLRACPSCRDEFDTLRWTDRTLLEWASRQITVPQTTDTRVLRAIDNRRRFGPLAALNRVMPAAVGSSIAAVLVALTINAGLLYRSPPSATNVKTHTSQHAVKPSLALAVRRQGSAILNNSTTSPFVPNLRHSPPVE